MATIATSAFSAEEAAKTILQCRVVSVVLTSVADADTYKAGPNLLTCAWESAVLDTGEVGLRIIDRETGEIEFDSAAAGNSGTLWLFYGHSGRAN